MSEISTVKGLSLDPIRNIEMHKKYQMHINKIIEITNKKSNLKQITQEQKRISEVLKKSKELSKGFKDKQFLHQKCLETERLKKSLSTIQTRKFKAQADDELLRKRVKTLGKQEMTRQFQIQRENKIIAQSIMNNMCDVQQFKKKISKEILEYKRLKSHLQKLKPIKTDRTFHYQQGASMNLKNMLEHKATISGKKVNDPQSRQEQSQS